MYKCKKKKDKSIFSYIYHKSTYDKLIKYIFYKFIR